jgi:hypothetical protein
VAWVRRYWPATRSVLVALLLVVALIDGCPIPSNTRTAPALLPTVKSLRKLRTTLMKPTKKVRDGFRLHQTWKLFPTANLNQHRMWVEGRTDRKAEWEILYRPDDPEHTFKADEIEFRRLRGAWNPGRSPRRGYTPFTKWVAREIFAARPDLNEVRVRLENIKVKPKQGTYESVGKFQFERSIRREVVREKPVVESGPVEEDPDP